MNRVLSSTIFRHLLRTTALTLNITLSAGLVTGPGVLAQAPARASATSGVRHITLEGAPNLRDLGGYPTADGRHVRWRKIYRAGELSRLTEADYKVMSGLGISVVCDFRRDSERAAAPTAWKGANPPEILNLPGSQGARTAGESATNASQAGLSSMLLASYPTYPTTLAASYRTVIDQLMTKDGAVLYHCTAGKDRTGTFSAMLLTMLGVPREIVMEDYLLTNQYVATPARVDALVARGSTRESAIATIGVDRAYLEQMFKTIDAEFGSFDEYRRKALGLSDQDLVRLKARLLE